MVRIQASSCADNGCQGTKNALLACPEFARDYSLDLPRLTGHVVGVRLGAGQCVGVSDQPIGRVIGIAGRVVVLVVMSREMVCFSRRSAHQL